MRGIPSVLVILAVLSSCRSERRAPPATAEPASAPNPAERPAEPAGDVTPPVKSVDAGERDGEVATHFIKALMDDDAELVRSGVMRRAEPGAELEQAIGQSRTGSKAVDGQVEGRRPRSRVRISVQRVGDETSLDQTAVEKRIEASYVAAFQRCHERALKKDPGAGGSVVVAFTVGPTGRVTESKVTAFDQTVGDCIGGLARLMRFDPPKDGGGSQVSARFEMVGRAEPIP